MYILYNSINVSIVYQMGKTLGIGPNLYQVGIRILYLNCALQMCLFWVLVGFQFSCDLYYAANQENI